MARLPNKQFWVNWNARNYDATTHTIAKESGQLFDQDLVLHTAAQTYTDSYVTIDSSNSRILFNFNSTAENPFNRTSATATLTVVAKTRTTGTTWFVSNRRDGTVGWMVRQGTDKYSMAYNDEWYYYTSNTAPMTMAWRNGNGTMQYISISDNVTGTPYSSTTWVGQQTTQFVVFGSGSGENWTGDFYWVYISPEVLTDEEIAQVVAYNENSTTFNPSQDTFSFDYTGGSETFTVEADNSWTAATPTYFTVSPLSGTAGTTTVTVTATPTASARNETVTFTDTETNTFDISIAQSGDGKAVPFKHLIIGTRRIN